MWDIVYSTKSAADSTELWGYTDGMTPHPELVSYIAAREYDSVLDAACSVGLMIGKLAMLHPDRSHYGTDISTAMAKASAQRCAVCHVGTFDLSGMQHIETVRRRAPRGFPREFPTSFDYVYLSDVLYYIAWDGIPPALYHSGLAKDDGESLSQRRFWKRLLALARKEVVFSDHQQNERVVRFLRKMGAEWRAHDRVWVARGTAPPA